MPTRPRDIPSSLLAFETATDRLRRRHANVVGRLPVELRALELIPQGVDSPGRLRTRLDLSSGGITALLGRLERDLLIHRLPDPRDRRSRLLKLTSAGRELLRPLNERLDAILETARVDGAEEDTVRQFLSAATNAVAQLHTADPRSDETSSPTPSRPPIDDVCEHVFVSNAGSGVTPYPIFQQAVDAGDLSRATQLARTLPPRTIVVPGVAIREAVALTRHIGNQREHRYDEAAGRLLALILLDARTMALEDAQQLLAALVALPERPNSALEVIVPILQRYGVSVD